MDERNDKIGYSSFIQNEYGGSYKDASGANPIKGFPLAPSFLNEESAELLTEEIQKIYAHFEGGRSASSLSEVLSELQEKWERGICERSERINKYLKEIIAHYDAGRFEEMDQSIGQAPEHIATWQLKKESHPFVRQQVLMALNSIAAIADLAHGDSAKLAVYQNALALINAWHLETECHSGVREIALRCFFEAAIITKDIHAYQPALALIAAWRLDNEPHHGVRELALSCLLNARLGMGFAAGDVANLAAYQPTLALITAWQLNNESHPDVRKMALRWLYDARIELSNICVVDCEWRSWREFFRHLLLAPHLFSQNVGLNNWEKLDAITRFKPSLFQLKIDNRPEYLWSSLTAMLEEWLTDWHHLGYRRDCPNQFTQLLHLSEALLLLDTRHAMHEYQELLQAIYAIDRSFEDFEVARRRRANTLNTHWLNLFPEAPQPDEAEIIGKINKLSWWESLWKGQSVNALLQALATRKPTPDLDAIDKLVSKTLRWFAQGIRNAIGLFNEAGDPGATLLAIALAANSMDEEADAIINCWIQAEPWQDDVSLVKLIEATGWRKTFLDETGKHLELYYWTGKYGHPRLAHSQERGRIIAASHRDIDLAIAAYAQGNLGPVRELLQKAWQRIVTRLPAGDKLTKHYPAKVETLARLLCHWHEGDKCLDWRKIIRDKCAYQEECAYTYLAISTLLFGDIDAQLEAALRKRHAKRLTPEPDPHRAWHDQKRALGELMGAYPMRPYAGKISKLFHDLVCHGIREQLAANTPEITLLWNHLERGRIALNGFRQPLQDFTPPAEVVHQAVDALAYELEQLERFAKGERPEADALYVPFNVWLKAAEGIGLVLDIPTPAQCQERLKEGWALVQPFFDDNDGSLRVLWLSRVGDLTLARVPGAESQAWKPLLNAWHGFVESKEDQDPETLAPAWKLFTAQDSPARVLMEWLKEQAVSRGDKRLMVLWPGRLAQLPFEATEWVEPGFITRVVSLSTLQPVKSEGTKKQVLYDDDTRRAPSGAQEASAVAGHLDPVRVLKGSESTLPDGLAALADSSMNHWVIHGEYQAFQPTLSRFHLNENTFLPAWALAAVKLPGGCFSTSACETQLSGAAAHDLLGTTGLGAVLNVQGASVVIGPLWRSDIYASLIFYKHLYQAVEETQKQGEPLEWPKLVAHAQARLREMSKEEMAELLRDKDGKVPSDAVPFLRSAINPFYWAQFVVIGG